MRFALVTPDKMNNKAFMLNPEKHDHIGFMQWVERWHGHHYSFEAMSQDCSPLLEKDVVMMVGNPYHYVDIIKLGKILKGKVRTMFLPDGDVSMNDEHGINGFHKEIYQAWNACDVIAAMEEDKLSYYRNLTTARVAFVHVPIDKTMESGVFRVPRVNKGDSILVYGDNNPTCPMTALGVIKRLEKPVVTVAIAEEKLSEISDLLEFYVEGMHSKYGQYPYLRVLGRCYLHIYPTRCIGSSRAPIACAVAGTPCIGPDKSHTQRRLFPELACDIYDVDKMEALARKLYTDTAFYDHVCEQAFKGLNYYNMETTIGRFIRAADLPHIKEDRCWIR